MKKAIIRMWVIAMVFSLFGCGKSSKSVASDNVGDVMKKALEVKYDNEFDVADIESRTSDYLYTSNPGYKAVATDLSNNQTFNVQYNSNDGTVIDDYAKIIYGDRILTQVNQIIEKYDLVSIESTYINAPITSECWKGESEYYDYLKNSGVNVMVNMTVTTEEVAEQIYNICNEMENESIFFQFLITYNSNSVFYIFYTSDADNKPTLETIKSKFNKGSG